jgi:uncharacterized protein
MADIGFAFRGDVRRFVRRVGHNPGLLNARNTRGQTPLMCASLRGHVAFVRWLFQRGADPTIADDGGSTPLMMTASLQGRIEVVRLLLGHPAGKSTVNHRDSLGRTALWWACFRGRGDIARALLESGADATIADKNGRTPMAIAKQEAHLTIRAGGRRECVAALEVISSLPQQPLC